MSKSNEAKLHSCSLNVVKEKKMKEKKTVFTMHGIECKCNTSLCTVPTNFHSDIVKLMEGSFALETFYVV